MLFLLNGWYVDFEVDNTQKSEFAYNESVVINPPKAYLKGKILFKDGFEIDMNTDYDVEAGIIGTYTVDYEASFLGYNKSMTTFINIVDEEPPVITMQPLINQYITSEEDLLLGVSAVDAYDGDITDRITYTFANGVCTFSVEDTSGNLAVATKLVILKDTEAPKLTLLGDTSIVLKQGEVYKEPGYYAIDNIDGDLTSNVVVDGTINTNVIGDYRISYSVSDSMNNSVREYRKVSVLPMDEDITYDSDESENTHDGEVENTEDNTEEIPTENTENTESSTENTEEPKVENPEALPPEEDKIIGDRKVIYLTFDDGPGKYTRELLEILKKYNVKATFFVVGQSNLDVLTDIYNDGHSIGIHSLTHEYKTIYASEKAYFDDLYKMRDIIYEKTGHYTNLVRFPGGSSNTVSKNYSKGIMTRLAESLTEKGFVYFDWNVSSGDAGETTNSVEVYKNVVQGIGTKTTAIVLQHDTKKYSIDAVEDIILWGLGNDYIFLPLDVNSPTSHHKISN